MKDFTNTVDAYYDEAKEIVVSHQKVSVSLLQRKLRLGYMRAAILVDMLEKQGVIGKERGSKPREILTQEEK